MLYYLQNLHDIFQGANFINLYNLGFLSINISKQKWHILLKPEIGTVVRGNIISAFVRKSSVSWSARKFDVGDFSFFYETPPTLLGNVS